MIGLEGKIVNETDQSKDERKILEKNVMTKLDLKINSVKYSG